jgi:hypothetical protein
MPWPADNQADLEALFGRHQLRPDGRPTAAWERSHLITIATPCPLTLSCQRFMSKRAGSTVVEEKGSHAIYVSHQRRLPRSSRRPSKA